MPGTVEIGAAHQVRQHGDLRGRPRFRVVTQHASVEQEVPDDAAGIDDDGVRLVRRRGLQRPAMRAPFFRHDHFRAGFAGDPDGTGVAAGDRPDEAVAQALRRGPVLDGVGIAPIDHAATIRAHPDHAVTIGQQRRNAHAGQTRARVEQFPTRAVPAGDADVRAGDDPSRAILDDVDAGCGAPRCDRPGCRDGVKSEAPAASRNTLRMPRTQMLPSRAARIPTHLSSGTPCSTPYRMSRPSRRRHRAPPQPNHVVPLRWSTAATSPGSSPWCSAPAPNSGAPVQRPPASWVNRNRAVSAHHEHAVAVVGGEGLATIGHDLDAAGTHPVECPIAFPPLQARPRSHPQVIASILRETDHLRGLEAVRRIDLR